MIKKLLFIAFMSYGLSGISQNLELLYNGGSVGDTLSIEVPNLLSRNDIYIDIVNHATRPLSVKVRKAELFVVPGSENSFCFGEFCYDTDESPTAFTINASDTFSHASDGDQAFHISYYPDNNPGVSYIRYTFFNELDLDDTVSFVAEIIAIPSTDIAEQSEMQILVFPNPVIGNTIHIDYNHIDGINKEEKSIFSFTNAIGEIVTTIPLHQNSGSISINIEDLSSGIYFATITKKGQRVYTKKIIIP